MLLSSCRTSFFYRLSPSAVDNTGSHLVKVISLVVLFWKSPDYSETHSADNAQVSSPWVRLRRSDDANTDRIRTPSLRFLLRTGNFQNNKHSIESLGRPHGIELKSKELLNLTSTKNVWKNGCKLIVFNLNLYRHNCIISFHN